MATSNASNDGKKAGKTSARNPDAVIRAGDALPEPPGGPIPVAPVSAPGIAAAPAGSVPPPAAASVPPRPRRSTVPRSGPPSVKAKAANAAGPRPSNAPPSSRVPVARKAPLSTRVPAASRVPTRKSSAPRRRPLRPRRPRPKPPTRAAGAKAAPRSKAPAARADGKAASARDEASIPPTWSDVDDRGQMMMTGEMTPILPPAPRAAQVSPPAEDMATAAVPVPLTRAISPYVKGALGLAAAAALVLFARGAFRHAPKPAPAFAAAPAPVAETIPPPPADPAETAPVPAATDALPTASAAEDKRASLDALKQHKLTDAIAAGERSTVADPTDAEAWLVLGAAYTDQGSFAAAQRCYHSCATEAKRGDVRECKFLMR